MLRRMQPGSLDNISCILRWQIKEKKQSGAARSSKNRHPTPLSVKCRKGAGSRIPPADDGRSGRRSNMGVGVQKYCLRLEGKEI